MPVKDLFDLTGRVAVVTGGAGLLGRQHGETVAELGGIPVLVDIKEDACERVAEAIQAEFDVPAMAEVIDITQESAVAGLLRKVLERFGRIDILINNAARNPTRDQILEGGANATRLEHLPVEVWEADIGVGLTGAFLTARYVGSHMAAEGRGVILNIASDLGVIAPDQRIYRREGVPDEQQPVKPVTYSVVKHGLIGLTRYLATYWAGKGVRVNALSPGGVFAGQDAEFVERLTNLIPMGRMANVDEYKGAVAFLISDASSFMTGANLSVDGGRTTW